MAPPVDLRQARSLPVPGQPAGTLNEEMPFDHIVVVMMENHSFDNLLGALTLTHPDAEGLDFQNGVATNSNPGATSTPSIVKAFPLTTTAQGQDVSQNWKATHEQINGGAMDGFVRSMRSEQPMGYYTPEALPFAYSLASAFTLANSWFCSMPGPTYPEPTVSTRGHSIRRDCHERRRTPSRCRASTSQWHDLRCAVKTQHHMV